MTRECTGVCVYRMACRFLSLLLSPTNYPPPFEQTDKSQIHLAIFKAGVPTSSCECAPASAHTAPLRTRLRSRAGSLSVHPAATRAPCALLPSLSPPVPREQFLRAFTMDPTGMHRCTAARVRSGRSSRAPAIGSGRSPASAFAAATAPGSAPLYSRTETLS